MSTETALLTTTIPAMMITQKPFRKLVTRPNGQIIYSLPIVLKLQCEEEKVFIPTIKTVSSYCNLACRYCYYRDRNLKKLKIMGETVLESLIKRFLVEDTGRKVYFIWHGGEPLLAGLEFYQRALKFEEDFNLYAKEIKNGVQTNASLVNQKWADFFAENNFRVGVSIDGPEDIQDLNRPRINGRGSFESVYRGLKVLQQNGIYPSAIAVITRNSLDRAKEIFDFFIENKIYVFYPKPCYEVDTAGKLLNFSITPDEYTDFMIEIFDLWMETNNPRIRIRNLYEIIKSLVGGKSNLCEFSGNCQAFLTVEHDGAVGACDSFPLDQYYMGNIIQNSIEEIFTSNGYKKLLDDISESKKFCFGCSWMKMCHGGCTRYSYSFESGQWYRNIFCESKKRLFSYIKMRITELEKT